MQKILMTSKLNDDGNIVPVSILQTQDVICLKKIIDENQVYRVIVGFFKLDDNKQKRFNKSFLNGSYQSKDEKRRFIREFITTKEKFNKLEELKEISIADFIEVNKKIKVTGLVKGCGFTGAMKRHGFAGQPASHGISLAHRSLGSTGSRKPRRVMKGRKMAGRYGGHQVTLSGINVEKIIDKNTIVIKGSVPGSSGSFVIINK